MQIPYCGEKISPENFLIDETPKRHSLSQSAWFEVSCERICSVVRSVGRQKKRNGEVKSSKVR
jgi:hypothetical protein